MTDQCKHCELKGNIEGCLNEDCLQHDSWYAQEQQKKIEELTAKRSKAVERLLHLQDKIVDIKLWCVAYPIDIFPEPDLQKAAKVLKENNMRLDDITASNMRHVLKGIQAIINKQGE